MGRDEGAVRAYIRSQENEGQPLDQLDMFRGGRELNGTYQLHPPVLDETGLASGVSEYAGGFMQRSGIKVTLGISPVLGRLPAETERALFRVVQEDLGNVHRHSGGRTATIRIGRQSLGAVLEVKDEGHGLTGMWFDKRCFVLFSLSKNAGN